MTELIELRPLKSGKTRRSHQRSYKFTTADTSSGSSDDDSDSGDEAPVVLSLPSKSSKKASKRHHAVQALPIIVNNRSMKDKKRRDRKQIQQFLINAQPEPPPPPKAKKEIVINQVIERPPTPEVQYVPVLAPTPPMHRMIDRHPYAYRRAHTPTVIEDRSLTVYNSCSSPTRRLVRRYPHSSKRVHLPKHAEKLVNRFLSGMEYAHAYRYIDDSDSDCSIDDCRVCRRLRSAMRGGRHRSSSELDHYLSGRLLLKDPHRYRHHHARHCDVCDLMGHSDIVISKATDTSIFDTRTRDRHVHVVEKLPSTNKPQVETTTTTTTTMKPKVTVSSAPPVVPPAPVPMPFYPMPYPMYPGLQNGPGYAFDPSWQYSPYGQGLNYDYSSYYNNPMFGQGYPQYPIHPPAITAFGDPSLTSYHQPQPHYLQSNTDFRTDPVITEVTHTRRRDDRQEYRPTNESVVVHTSPRQTPPASKVTIQHSRPSRLPRQRHSRTVIKEETTRAPHTTTTSHTRT